MSISEKDPPFPPQSKSFAKFGINIWYNCGMDHLSKLFEDPQENTI